MEPSYIFILFLALIAARLIYDNTIGKGKAMKTLLELADKQNELRQLFDKSHVMGNHLHPHDDPDTIAASFSQINHSYQRMIIMFNECEYLDRFFTSQYQKLPIHYQSKLSTKYDWLNRRWIKEKEIHASHKHFLQKTENYIGEYYTPASLPMLEFAKEFFAKNDIISIQCRDGGMIDTNQIKHDIDKWHLNQKLQANLPPRTKTKVVKI